MAGGMPTGILDIPGRAVDLSSWFTNALKLRKPSAALAWHHRTDRRPCCRPISTRLAPRCGAIRATHGLAGGSGETSTPAGTDIADSPAPTRMSIKGSAPCSGDQCR